MLQLNGPALVSSFCSADKPQCVSVRWVVKNDRGPITRAVLGPRTLIQVTDTKLGAASPVYEFTPREWRAFLGYVPYWLPAADGMYRLGDLAFTPDEYKAFAEGARHSEFQLTTV